MVSFIDAHRAEYGVEPICAMLPIASSTYHRHRRQQVDPTRQSMRAHRDEALRLEIQRVCDAHHQVYGPRKVWKQLQREGARVARCTVRRLMRDMGLRGAVRGRAWIATTYAGNAARPRDLVDRQFVATRPNQLWVSDFTYVATWSGFAYVALIVDIFDATDCRLARLSVDADGLRPRCLGASDLRASGRRAHRARAPQ
jgi:putative transposase